MSALTVVEAPDVRMTWTIREAQMFWSLLALAAHDAPEGSVLREELTLQRNKLEINGTADWGRGWWQAGL